jgi:transposase-like protein
LFAKKRIGFGNIVCIFAEKTNMKCPKCKSERSVRNGIIKGVQRYKCKECGCNYTVGYEQVYEKEKKKRFGLSMYMEGLGFHAISGLLNVSHVAVMNWVKKYGAELKSIRNPKPVKIMKPDEMHSCAGREKTTDGTGLALIERKENTLISLLGREAGQGERKSGISSPFRTGNKALFEACGHNDTFIETVDGQKE